MTHQALLALLCLSSAVAGGGLMLSAAGINSQSRLLGLAIMVPGCAAMAVLFAEVLK